MILNIDKIYSPTSDIDYDHKPDYNYLFERIDKGLLTEVYSLLTLQINEVRVFAKKYLDYNEVIRQEDKIKQE